MVQIPNKPKSIALGWTALLTVGFGILYFAKEEIAARRKRELDGWHRLDYEDRRSMGRVSPAQPHDQDPTGNPSMEAGAQDGASGGMGRRHDDPASKRLIGGRMSGDRL
ncbi:hypothetical protein YB2330_001009 [Saitoella coloradoensis]